MNNELVGFKNSCCKLYLFCGEPLQFVHLCNGGLLFEIVIYSCFFNRLVHNLV